MVDSDLYAIDRGEDAASEFFEAMDADSVDECLIDPALGAGVVQEYANWLYINLK